MAKPTSFSTKDMPGRWHFRHSICTFHAMDESPGASAPPRFSGQKNDRAFPHGALTERILGAAIHVHRKLGPGFIEKMYENAFCLELTKRGIPFDRQVAIHVDYEGTEIGMHRLDLVIEKKVVVEIKAIKEVEDVHLATVLSYLKATGLSAGLILNYRAARLGIRRVVSTGQVTAEARRSGRAET